MLPEVIGTGTKNIAKQYGLDLNYRKEVGKALKKCLDMPGGMTVVAAAVAAIKIDELQLKREEFEDKKDRLDRGKPTDIIGDSNDLNERLAKLASQLAINVQGARVLGSVIPAGSTAIVVPAKPVCADEDET